MVFFNYFSINKESIIDLHAQVVAVSSKIESCTVQTVELSVLEIYLVSPAKPQLPLQIEDASRPEKNDVITNDQITFVVNSLDKICYKRLKTLLFERKSIP